MECLFRFSSSFVISSNCISVGSILTGFVSGEDRIWANRNSHSENNWCCFAYLEVNLCRGSTSSSLEMRSLSRGLCLFSLAGAKTSQSLCRSCSIACILVGDCIPPPSRRVGCQMTTYRQRYLFLSKGNQKRLSPVLCSR